MAVSLTAAGPKVRMDLHSWQATDGSADVLRTYTVPANKRPLDRGDDDLEGEGAAMSTDAPSSAEAAGPSEAKRARAAADVASGAPATPAAASAVDASAAAAGGAAAPVADHNTDATHPFADPALPSCVIKIYQEEHGLKLNDLVEVFAILTYHHGLDVLPSTDASFVTLDDYMDNEHLRGQPSSRVPRLHCLAWTPLGTSNGNPLFGRRTMSPWNDLALVGPVARDILEVRRTLIQYLAIPFGGDELVAEYTLLHLISAVRGRVDLRPIGRFLLNVTGCPRTSNIDGTATSALAAGTSELGRAVQETVRSLLPRSVLISLTLNVLNRLAFTPRKDVHANRLTTGLLQLSPGTHVTIDETAMQEGKLESSGLANLKALHKLMETQTVEYELPFQSMSFPTDAPVLVLSEGNSLLPADCAIHLMPRGPVGSLPQLPLARDWFLPTARAYLGLARCAEYTIASDMSDFIQNDFVTRRQAAAAAQQPLKTQDDLFYELSLARLVAVSFGENGLSRERWEYMRALESQRHTRLAPSPANR